MEKLHENSHGMSRVEVICLVGIAAISVVATIAAFFFVLDLFQKGDDALTLNTAKGVARAESANLCLVPGCPAEGAVHEANHVNAAGNCYAFYDKGRNALTDERPAGYNEARSVEIDGKSMEVGQATMVVLATRQDGDVQVQWTPAQ